MLYALPLVKADRNLLARDHHSQAQHQSYQRRYMLASKYLYKTKGVKKQIFN